MIYWHSGASSYLYVEDFYSLEKIFTICPWVTEDTETQPPGVSGPFGPSPPAACVQGMTCQERRKAADHLAQCLHFTEGETGARSGKTRSGIQQTEGESRLAFQKRSARQLLQSTGDQDSSQRPVGTGSLWGVFVGSCKVEGGPEIRHIWEAPVKQNETDFNRTCQNL